MERRHLEYFVAIVDHGGYTAASQALRVAQPSLSQVIKTLERELGIEVFQRLRSGIRLTSAGEALLGPARQVLREFESARAAVSSAGGLVGGRLDIAATTGLVTGVLPELLGEFHRLHPHVSIRVTDPGLANVASLVRSREVEVGISYFAPTAEDLDVYFLSDVEGVLALPPGSPPEPRVRPLRDLEQIGLVVDSTAKVFLLRLLSDHGITPRFVAETHERGAVIPMMLEGIGAAVVGSALARYASALGAVVCQLEPTPRQNVVVVSRPDHLSSAATALCRIVEARSERCVRSAHAGAGSGRRREHQVGRGQRNDEERRRDHDRSAAGE
jgi:LysR family carnitine catabolism transcriptional activator